MAVMDEELFEELFAEEFCEEAFAKRRRSFILSPATKERLANTRGIQSLLPYELPPRNAISFSAQCHLLPPCKLPLKIYDHFIKDKKDSGVENFLKWMAWKEQKKKDDARTREEARCGKKRLRSKPVGGWKKKVRTQTEDKIKKRDQRRRKREKKEANKKEDEKDKEEEEKEEDEGLT